jgi:hypothetical protein
MASEIKLPIKFQNEKAHSFAHNIQGISVGIELSHPKVVTAKLEDYNSTLSLTAHGNGECNIVVYLTDKPEIYDVFKVRVTQLVRPESPVYVHVGGEVTFDVIDDDSQGVSSDSSGFKPTWSSSSPAILDINHSNGKANGLSEGQAKILLSNHVNAASNVYV